MPLSFQSQNHGNIAFGFFNIESDMLLLENYFFFAQDFCQWMNTLANQDEKEFRNLQSQVFLIENPMDIGDLMGAIHGVRFTGFIGKVYKLFPFPSDPMGFKQNPEGYQTRQTIACEIEKFSKKINMEIKFLGNGQIKIGQYLFDKTVFHELIRYVWQGGYPRWKDEIRPQYVNIMKNNIIQSDHSFFKGVFSSQGI